MARTYLSIADEIFLIRKVLIERATSSRDRGEHDKAGLLDDAADSLDSADYAIAQLRDLKGG